MPSPSSATHTSRLGRTTSWNQARTSSSVCTGGGISGADAARERSHTPAITMAS